MEKYTERMLFTSLSPSERAVFFVEMMKHGDEQVALTETLKDFTTHETVEMFLGPGQRFIVGTDFVEDGDILHIYSDSVETINGYVKELMEHGEILETITFNKRKRLYHKQLLSVNAFCEETELLPIIYN